MSENKLHKTLTELENINYGKASPDDTYLVRTCHELREKKLVDFTIEDLRIMIGQKEALQYLIPLALEYLSEDPFAEGNYYEGDLLENVLRSPSEFWIDHKDSRIKMNNIISLVRSNNERISRTLERLIASYEENNDNGLIR